jgi:hypothetical protein
METRNGTPSPSTKPPSSTYTTYFSRLVRKELKDLNSGIDPIKAAYQVGPRGYRLINGPEDVFVTFCNGCFGEESKKRKDVAIRMNAIAAYMLRKLKQRVSLILGVGDNFYPDGVDHYTDRRFKEQFHDTYGDPVLEFIARVPWWLCLGNHDLKLHKWKQIMTSVSSYVSTYTANFIRAPISITGEAVGIHQSAYTYTTQPNDPCPVPKRDFFSGDPSEIKNIDINHLAQWNMPFIYDFAIWENVQIFILNSSEYPLAWLKKKKEEVLKQNKKMSMGSRDKENINGIDEVDLFNQAIWFEADYKKAKANNMTTVVVMHHPLFTVTPRAFNYKGDARLYFKNPNDLKEILALLNLPEDCVVFNEILRRIFEEEGLVFDAVICAHDHCNYYYNNKLDGCDLFLMSTESEIILISEEVRKNAQDKKIPVLIRTKIKDQFFIYGEDKEGIWAFKKVNSKNVDLNTLPFKEGKIKQLKCNKFEFSKAIITALKEGHVPFEKNDYYKICQITTGGGGGDLQDRANFKEHHNIGGFLKYHGFASLTFKKNEPGLIYIELFTTEGHHLKFTNKSPHPIRENSKDKKVETLRDCILYASHQYQDFLNENQIYHGGKFFWPADNLYTHKLSDTHIMHDMLNFVNSEIPSDFETMASTLLDLAKKISNKTSPHSLFLFIINKLKEEEKVIGDEVIKRFLELDVLNQPNNANHLANVNETNDKKSPGFRPSPST